jgi:hypothetical protein
MPADPPSSPVLRASDADRDRVIELLRAAVAGTPAEPAAELLTIKEKHGPVRRDGQLAISTDAGDDTPETLHVRLVGRMRHARLSTRWQAPRR